MPEMSAPERYTQDLFDRDDASSTSAPSEEADEGGVVLTADEKAQVESCYRSLSTEVVVCGCVAELYTAGRGEEGWGRVGGPAHWVGVPVMLADLGGARSRATRSLRLVLAERGSGFALWSDPLDNLSGYTAVSPTFHIMALSTDHTRSVGLRFGTEMFAKEFLTKVEHFTSDPLNIGLSPPNKNMKKLRKPKPPPVKQLSSKLQISQPCCFMHVTNIAPSDATRYTSIQRLLPTPSQIEKSPAQPV